ncbi:hypothetical protein FI667_g10296, partial [Globisporangium splendens]
MLVNEVETSSLELLAVGHDLRREGDDAQIPFGPTVCSSARRVGRHDATVLVEEKQSVLQSEKAGKESN